MIEATCYDDCTRIWRASPPFASPKKCSLIIGLPQLCKHHGINITSEVARKLNNYCDDISSEKDLKTALNNYEKLRFQNNASVLEIKIKAKTGEEVELWMERLINLAEIAEERFFDCPTDPANLIWVWTSENKAKYVSNLVNNLWKQYWKSMNCAINSPVSNILNTEQQAASCMLEELLSYVNTGTTTFFKPFFQAGIFQTIDRFGTLWFDPSGEIGGLTLKDANNNTISYASLNYKKFVNEVDAAFYMDDVDENLENYRENYEEEEQLDDRMNENLQVIDENGLPPLVTLKKIARAVMKNDVINPCKYLAYIVGDKAADEISKACDNEIRQQRQGMFTFCILCNCKILLIYIRILN